MTNPLVDIAAATTVAGVIVALLKMAWPSAPAYIIVLSSVIGGVFAALLVAMSNNAVWTQQNVALIIINGILAAGTAAGVRKIDQFADQQRQQAQRPPIAVPVPTEGVQG